MVSGRAAAHARPSLSASFSAPLETGTSLFRGDQSDELQCDGPESRLPVHC